MTRETDRETNGSNDYRGRFEQLQAQFIDEPRTAVRSAQSLVEEAIDRMMEGMRHSGADDKADTEQLRLTMRRYRDLIYQLTEEHQPASAQAPMEAPAPEPEMMRTRAAERAEESEPMRPPAEEPVATTRAREGGVRRPS